MSEAGSNESFAELRAAVKVAIGNECATFGVIPPEGELPRARRLQALCGLYLEVLDACDEDQHVVFHTSVELWGKLTEDLRVLTE